MTVLKTKSCQKGFYFVYSLNVYLCKIIIIIKIWKHIFRISDVIRLNFLTLLDTVLILKQLMHFREFLRSKDGQEVTNHANHFRILFLSCKTLIIYIISHSLYHWKIQRIWRNVWQHINCKSALDPCDLWALRWHCIKTRHDSVMETTAWARERFQKSLWTQFVVLPTNGG